MSLCLYLSYGTFHPLYSIQSTATLVCFHVDLVRRFPGQGEHKTWGDEPVRDVAVFVDPLAVPANYFRASQHGRLCKEPHNGYRGR